MNGPRPISSSGGGGIGLTGPVPRDLWLLLGLVFVTFTLQFPLATRWLPAALRLGPDLWQRGFLWQLVSYPFIGVGRPDFWFVIGLVILLMFGRDVLLRLGRRRFWALLLQSAAISALAALAVRLLQLAVGATPVAAEFDLLQGQYFLLTVLIAAFASLNSNATILLFFVLPIQARWFLLLEIVFAFLGLLRTGDLAGFVGLCTGVGCGVWLSGGSLGSGPLRDLWLRGRQFWLRLRLAWLRRRRGLRVVRDERREGPDRWIH